MGLLRSIFRHHEAAVWQQLSDELSGRFEHDEGWRHDKVRVKHGDWDITVELYGELGYKHETIYTRLRAAFHNPEGFHFTVEHRSVLTKLARLLRVGAPRMGYREIDDSFVVRTNDKRRMRLVWANERLRRLIGTEPYVRIRLTTPEATIASEFPEGSDELCLMVEGEVSDLARMQRLYAFFAELLHSLCHVSPAFEDDPHLTPT